MPSHARYARRLWQVAKRPPWRTFLLAAAVLGMLGLTYLAWSPGARVRDGRHDRRANGIWLQHGWLGDDSWFRRNRRDTTLFRDDARVRALAERLASHGMKHVFPHLCPCAPDGTIPPVDAAQTEKFLDHVVGISVVPWIGGVLGTHCSPESATWRAQFVASTVALLTRHPRLAGVQVNIEPLPSGNKGFLAKLVGGVAIINVGAATEIEMKEKKARVEDALHATRAAVEEGIVAGGGVALVRAQKVVEAAVETLEGDQKIGAGIVLKALEEPLRQIVNNTGLEGAVVVNKVKDMEGNNGFDARTEEYCDLVKAGIIDPTKVTRNALQNAASVSGLLVTTEASISDKPSEGGDMPMPPMGGGMGGMGGGMPGMM